MQEESAAAARSRSQINHEKADGDELKKLCLYQPAFEILKQPADAIRVSVRLPEKLFARSWRPYADF